MAENQLFIEAQIINYILDQGNTEILDDFHITPDYFPGFGDEIRFILDHQTEYDVVPDPGTFIDKFEDFELFEVFEAPRAMADKIKEDYGYSLLAPAIVEINELARTDATKAVSVMFERAEKIMNEIKTTRFNNKFDLFGDMQERIELYKKMMNIGGLKGCITGIPQFDKAFNGLLNEDFAVITARPEGGKSWILEYMLLQCWLIQKKKIGLWSLENSRDVVGYRADTLLGHFGNTALMSGLRILGFEGDMPKLDLEDYERYAEQMQSASVPFRIYTNDDHPDGVWTIEDIWEVAEREDFDLIGIDQLTLLGFKPRVANQREGYVHTTRMCRKMVNERHKPIILNTQSGREAAKQTKRDDGPLLHQIYGSDSIGQDATKVFALQREEGVLRVHLRKNTLGPSGLTANLRWDINYGYLTPVILPGDENDQGEMATNAF